MVFYQICSSSPWATVAPFAVNSLIAHEELLIKLVVKLLEKVIANDELTRSKRTAISLVLMNVKMPGTA